MRDHYSVLHVVESFGGGVASALEQYSSGTDHLTHHLLRAVRSGSYAGDESALAFASIGDLPSRPLAAIRVIRETIQKVKPDVIHAHSSFAGLFVRLGVRARKETPIVYTPHGYSYERTDISRPIQAAFRAVEKMLAYNTSVYAACSPRETYLSQQLNKDAQVVYVPNVASIKDVHTLSPAERKTFPFEVAGVGRITPARDPAVFAEIASLVMREDKDIKFCWIGGGDEEATRQLISAGVEVTGWQTRDSAVQRLSKAKLLLHAAAWDGFPMVLLEANQLRIPSVVRSIPAFETMPAGVKGEDAKAIAEQILDMAHSTDTYFKTLEYWDSYLEAHSPQNQSDNLMHAYSLALGKTNVSSVA